MTFDEWLDGMGCIENITVKDLENAFKSGYKAGYEDGITSGEDEDEYEERTENNG